ncbi:synaptotagmin-8 isoform X7 [Macaca nemestrina]|uniref:synaptotagmin-8 isoform X7 n=1 Tax=Macaca nemestrina TaxID=9545 RepID=UPI0039B96FE7
MGHPPDSPSALAPAGTTAIPGLIPDLIAGTPWPRWALIAGALAAGVLIISCLLCAACCCCRRHRKKPRDKEAVGLGSARGITTTHLVQPDVDSLESSPGGAQQWGRLQLSLEYDFGSQEIRVGLRQAANLRPGGTVDPYARVSVSTQSGHRHETKVHRGTLCPVFDETCCFHIPQAELPGTTLQVQLFNFKRFSGHEPLGELRLPLGTVDLQHVLEHWYPLSPPAATEPEQVAELCFSLRYVPSSGRLTVVVLEARGLRPGLAEPYVKVQLMLNQRKWKKRKTATRKGTAAPYFNEAFTFLVPFSQVQVGLREAGAERDPVPDHEDHSLSPPTPTHGLSLHRMWTWCWPSGTAACRSGLSPWARCTWVPGPRGSPCNTGQTCWPTPGGPLPSGTPCSQPGRWTACWPCSPACACTCPCPTPERAACLGLPAEPRHLPRPPCRTTAINAFSCHCVSGWSLEGMQKQGLAPLARAPPQ